MKVRQGTERVIEKALLHWVGGIGRHPALALMALALLTGLAIFAALNDLKINTDSSEMIDGREPFRVNARAMDDAFPNLKNQILVIVRADTPDEADYVTGALADSLKTRRDLFQDVFSPASDPFFQRQGLLFLDLGDLIDMSSKMSSSGPLLRELMDNPGIEGFFTQLSRAAQASEEGIGLPMVAGAYREVADVIDALLQGEKRPLSWQHMFGRDDAINQRVLVIHPILDYQSLQPARAAVDAVRAAIDSLPDEIVEAADIALTGDPVLRTEELKSVSQGIEISALVSLILVAALLMIGLRRWQFVLSALLGLVVSIILTAGFAALAIGELNLVSIAFTVLLIGLGIDFAIHLLLQYREQRGRHADHFAAMAAAISEVGPALFLATVTTSFAFFAFVPTRFVGMAQLGIISGIGVLIAFAVAITLIPACLALWPKTAPPPNALPPVKEPSLWRRRITYGLAGGTVLLSLVAATALPNVRFDADPMNLRDPQSLAVLAFELLFDRDQDVPYRLNYLAPDHEAAQAFTAAVKEKPAVRTTISLDSFVPEDQDLKLDEIDFLAGDMAFVLIEGDDLEDRMMARTNPDQEAAERAVGRLMDGAKAIAETDAGTERGIAAQQLFKALDDFSNAAREAPVLYTELDRQLMRFFPMQIERLRLQLTARPVTLETLPPDIRARYVSENGLVRVEVLPKEDVRDPKARRAFVDEVSQVNPALSGGAVSVLAAGDVVSHAMIQATITALALAALLIFALVRRVGFVLMVLLPLVLAGLLTAAMGVWLDRPFNFANVIVLPLLIGLGVDSAIHLVMRARHLAQDGGKATAVFSTSTPRAVLLSALTTIGSFGSLALSSHRGTASMGELLMLAIGFTLLTTLIVLPVLLQLGNRFGNGAKKA